MAKVEQETQAEDPKARSAGDLPLEVHHEVERVKQQRNSSQILKILF
jgi:hypothetical protein